MGSRVPIRRYDEDKALSVFLMLSRINVDTKMKKEDKLRQVQSNCYYLCSTGKLHF